MTNRNKANITREIDIVLPTKYGDFQMVGYVHEGIEHVALIKWSWNKDDPILVRMHSSCLTWDIFGSLRCDCGDQLDHALELIEKEGKGVVVYLNQEGRGIGLINKLKAYKLQEQWYDTVQANEKLWFPADLRDFSLGVAILEDLGIHRIRLITNNPKKSESIEQYGLELVENVPVDCGSNTHNAFYLQTKKDKMGHRLS